MSKADELAKKMGQKPVFTPRESVSVRPIVPEAKPAIPPTKQGKPTMKPTEPTVTKKKETVTPELVPLYSKIPKDDKRWLDHHKIDTGKELGEIVSEAVQLLKKHSSK